MTIINKKILSSFKYIISVKNAHCPVRGVEDGGNDGGDPHSARG